MTLIQLHDGTMYDLLDYGIRTRDLIISSPTPNHHFTEIEGMNGVLDNGTTYGPREIMAYYRAMSHDRIDFSLLRDEIFNLFRTEESFYLIEKRERGKRWLVKVVNPFAIPQRNVYGDFEVEFIGIRGVSESIGTTQDIHNNGINADDGLWGFGMGLEAVDESLIYTHTGTEFEIFNPGVEVDPFEQDLTIEISDVEGSTSYLQLENQTTGDVFRVTEAVNGNQLIKLDGPNITSNNLQYLRKTNRKYITLAPGWNNFRVTGATGVKVSFDFRFYYL